ncbi:hypothetical protein HDK90DRAFT_159790 [Phyllosticta capitalensis]|uniref:Uncharacterized protein n=1 Tax=Phyllosticta capitalensis TaxID=121624 RepID=A0ABR1Z0J3_9PEZI
MTLPSPHLRQNLPGGSGTMELAKTDNANKELSSEQKKARRVAKVNSELAKLEEMNTVLEEMMEAIIQGAKHVTIKASSDKSILAILKDHVDEHHLSSGQALASTATCVRRMGDDNYDYDSDNPAQTMSEVVDLALRLVRLEKSTREKITLLTEGQDGVQDGIKNGDKDGDKVEADANAEE